MHRVTGSDSPYGWLAAESTATRKVVTSSFVRADRDLASSADAVEAVSLGMTMGEEARAGRDKLTVVVPEPFAAFGLWVEQLVAESTGAPNNF